MSNLKSRKKLIILVQYRKYHNIQQYIYYFKLQPENSSFDKQN